MALYKGNVKLAGIGVSNGIITSATAPVSPVEGMVWYDTTNDQLKVYDGANWNVTGKEYIQGNGINIANDTVSVDTTVVATKTDLATKQDTLVSGTNIKTINNTSLLGSGNISISGDAKVFTYPSVGSNVSDLRNWAWFNHKTAFLNTTGTLQYVDNYVVTQCVEYGLGGGYNEIYATNGTSIVKIEVDGDTNTVVSITTTPTGGLQVSPNSTITGIKYIWYGTESDYANLSQYYTDQPGDTEFHTF